jgi:hypothetical protein
MDLCEVYGSLVDAQKEPLPSVLVFASCVEHARETLDTSTGEIIGIGTLPIHTVTTSTGSFSLDLIKKKTYRIVIRPLGYDRIITVPDAESVNLWTLSGSNVNTIITTSTGSTIVEDPNW